MSEHADRLRRQARAVHDATPPSHDRVIDLVRAAAILGVVVGHWLIDEFLLAKGGLIERSNLGLVPRLWPLTWLLMVMPLFFFVGGWSNRRSWESSLRRGFGYATFLDRRTHRLLAPTLLYLSFLVVAALVVRLGPDSLEDRIPRDTAVLATQPLWFLGIYLAVVALTPATLALHRAWGWGAVAVLAVAVVAADVARFALGLDAVGMANVALVWGLVHQLGYFEAEGRLGVRRGAAFATAGFVALCLLVAMGPYPARMVGVTGEEISNASPPNLAMLALAVWQIGVFEVLRPWLARLTTRPGAWLAVVVVNTAIMSVYLWHQVAHMAVAAVALPLGYPVPPAGTLAWWAATIGMVLLSAVALIGIVALVRPAEHRPSPPPVPPGTARSVLAGVAVSAVCLGILSLAGTAVTDLADTTTVLLGPLRASPLLGMVLLAGGIALLRALRWRSG